MTARAETAVGHQDRPSSPSKKVRTSFKNSRHYRTFFYFRGESFSFYPHPQPHRLLPTSPSPSANYQMDAQIALIQPKLRFLAVPATFFCGRHGKKQLTVVSAEQARNRKRFLPCVPILS